MIATLQPSRTIRAIRGQVTMEEVKSLIADLADALDAASAGLDAASGEAMTGGLPMKVKDALSSAANAVKEAQRVADAINDVVNG